MRTHAYAGTHTYIFDSTSWKTLAQNLNVVSSGNSAVLHNTTKGLNAGDSVIVIQPLIFKITRKAKERLCCY